jgi:peptidoglycan/LPS O-acetylase OafA/YrhL
VSDPRPRHWPALDGMRAVAVAAVMVYHLFEPHLLPGGYLGVDMFFVLSGFLITWGLVEERDRTGGVSFGRFYARRALRLLPALAAVLAFAAVLAYTVLPPAARRETLSGIPWVLLYVGNWDKALTSHTLGILAHLWSLGVEEQFYLLWPALLVLLLRLRIRRDHLAAALAVLAAVETGYREALFWTGTPVVRLAYGLDTHSDALMLGSAVALWLSTGTLQRVRPAVLRLGSWAAIAGLAVLAETGNGDFSFQWGYPLAAVATAALVAALATSTSPLLERTLSSRAAVWTGRRSYGLYVWSLPIYMGLPWPSRFTGPARDLAEMALSFGVAAVSYRVVELPFLRRKGRLHGLQAARTPPSPTPTPLPSPGAAAPRSSPAAARSSSPAEAASRSSGAGTARRPSPAPGSSRTMAGS